MPSIHGTRTSLLAAAACLIATVAVSACHDAAGDPLALLVTEETRSALQLGEDLPSLVDLVGREELEGELSGAIDLWLGSWQRDGEEAVELRERAYQEAAGPLARSVGHDGVVAAHARLGEALTAAAGVPEEDLGAEMRDRLANAADAHLRAAGLLDAGAGPAPGAAERDAEALAVVLRASDALRAVGPEGVARTLVAQAERALEGAAEEDLADIMRERGDRLVRGARMALDEGNWSRAIRRAYYACQVLGVTPL